MKYLSILLFILLTLFPNFVFAKGKSLSQHLQDISVTIKSGNSQGSGVIIRRTIDDMAVNFVWTAGHVIEGNRRVRTVIDEAGLQRQVVEFDDVSIVKELTEGGRRVGELKMEAKVIKYSGPDNGEDLALLMIRKIDFIETSASFFLNEEIPPLGIRLIHVGSLRGQLGAGSMTDGILSQVGRVYNGVVYDQTTVAAFPGSSGGGIYFADGSNQGKYIGMIVRGAGETFNLMVPVRRMKQWAQRVGVNFAIDEAVAAPTMDELLRMPIGETADSLNLTYPRQKDTLMKFLLLDSKK